ncbi:MAG: hypothetical protein J1F68_06345 [Clostridiales bacterium]|nr:hypothetical protein [Clostridiales bacterium]
MSIKSILYSVFAVLLAGGLLLLDVFLFGVQTILGIIGIVLILVVPGAMIRKANSEASGVLDKIIAKFIAPILILVVGFFVILGIFLWF